MKSPTRNHGRICVSLQKALLSMTQTPCMYMTSLERKEKKKVTWLFPEVGWEGEGECHCLPFVSFTLCLMNILFILSQIHKYVFFLTPK